MQIKVSFSIFELLLVLVLGMILYGLLFDSNLFRTPQVSSASFDVLALETIINNPDEKSKIKFICPNNDDCAAFNEMSIIKKIYPKDIFFEYNDLFYSLNHFDMNPKAYDSRKSYEHLQETLKNEAIASVF